MALSLESHFSCWGILLFSWHLPHYLNLRDVQEKWFLQQVLYRHLPQEIFYRAKFCFVLLVCLWPCGALREWSPEMSSKQYLTLEYPRSLE